MPTVDHLDVAVAGVVEGARVALADEEDDAGIGAADARLGGPVAGSAIEFGYSHF